MDEPEPELGDLQALRYADFFLVLSELPEGKPTTIHRIHTMSAKGLKRKLFSYEMTRRYTHHTLLFQNYCPPIVLVMNRRGHPEVMRRGLPSFAYVGFLSPKQRVLLKLLIEDAYDGTPVRICYDHHLYRGTLNCMKGVHLTYEEDAALDELQSAPESERLIIFKRVGYDTFLELTSKGVSAALDAKEEYREQIEKASDSIIWSAEPRKKDIDVAGETQGILVAGVRSKEGDFIDVEATVHQFMSRRQVAT